MTGRTGPDLRLVPVSLATWCAAWLLTGPAASSATMVAAGAVVLGAVVLALLVPARGRGRRGAVCAHLLLVLVGVGALAAGVQVQQAARGPLEDLATAGAVATLRGSVVSQAEPAPFGQGERWTLAVEHVDARGVAGPGRGHVEVTAPGDPPRYGARVEVDVRLGPPGIGAGTVAEAVALAPVAEAVAPGAVLRGTSRMRDALLDVTDGLSPQARGLVPGAAVGDTTRVPDDLDAAMRTSGLTHVTAVSGSHFAIVLAVATALLVAVRAPRAVRVPVLLVVAVGFVVLVRPEPSVLRAAWTCGVALLALALGRPAAGLPALATASTLLLMVDPWQSRSFGFALSCAATAGIVLLTGPLARRMAPWCGRAGAFALAVPWAAQIACGPVLVLLDPSVAVMSVPANVLAAPALVPATVLGLTATLLAPGAPGLATVVAWTAGLPTAWIAAVATFFAGLPGALLPWWSGASGALALAVVTAAVLVPVLRRPPGRGWTVLPTVRPTVLRRRTGNRRRRAVRATRPAAVTALAAAVLVPILAGAAVLLVVGRGAVGAGGPPADWQVVACDVGQGDTLVVRSGPSSAVVVDVGPPGHAAARCLDALGVRRVDLLVLSHFHTDHVGGLDAVLARQPVGAVLVSAVPEPAAPAQRTLAALAGSGARVTTGSRGLQGRAGDVGWRVLGAADTAGANDSSVAVSLRTAGGVDVVALGDLEEPGQDALHADLVADGLPDGPVEVLKMAHHGSASQSTRLARLLAPDVVLVPVGQNDYGHPTRAALDLYAGVGARTVRTDECGTAVLTVRAGRLALSCTGT
ncbi:ComEC/Rec2 family competence protein [Isoptericola jiangsuensis]|uniref:ComEC/Rec2 family competence protein n=1 Tax=Isoptericola jiangsuensis TaxID=548579 RepID=UPI003AB0A029